jgi:methylmalonyl-CoA/ethylmalonyl-CoA epimerase
MHDWELDHVTIAVRDLEKSKRIFSRIFKATFIKELELQEQNARAAFFLFNGIVIGLETPLSESGDLYHFLQRKGEGIHHIAFHGEQLNELQTLLQEEGMRVIGNQEKPEIRNEFFTHPKDSLGILLQMMEWEEPYKSSLEKKLDILGEE